MLEREPSGADLSIVELKEYDPVRRGLCPQLVTRKLDLRVGLAAFLKQFVVFLVTVPVIKLEESARAEREPAYIRDEDEEQQSLQDLPYAVPVADLEHPLDESEGVFLVVDVFHNS